MSLFNNPPDGWTSWAAPYHGTWNTDAEAIAGAIRGTGSYAFRLGGAAAHFWSQQLATPERPGLYRARAVMRTSDKTETVQGIAFSAVDAAGTTIASVQLGSTFAANNVWERHTGVLYVPDTTYAVYAYLLHSDQSSAYTCDVDQFSFTSEPLWFNAWRTGTQSINSGGWPGCTKVQLNTDTNLDPASSFDASTNYRWTTPYAGVWEFTGQIGWSDSLNDQTVTLAQIRVNGTSVAESDMVLGKAHSPVVPPAVTGPLSLAAGDYVELYCYHDHGVARNLNGGAGITFLHGCEVG